MFQREGVRGLLFQRQKDVKEKGLEGSVRDELQREPGKIPEQGQRRRGRGGTRYEEGAGILRMWLVEEAGGKQVACLCTGEQEKIDALIEAWYRRRKRGDTEEKL